MIRMISHKSGQRNSAMAITMTVMMTRMIIGKVNGINTKEQTIYSLFYKCLL